MLMPDPVFIGFRLVDDAVPEGFGKPFVCSMSDHVNSVPDDWVERWDWNDLGCYNSAEIALNTVSEVDRVKFTLFACRLYPMLFQKEGMFEVDVMSNVKRDDLVALSDADFSDYHCVGYDVANPPPNLAGGLLSFGCSPLSCNGCSAEFPVNDYYLLDSLETAMEAATTFGVEEPEPGPFCIYEVWRKTQVA